ncbi:MAG: ABC transporter ATP-binding protein [Burkholderiales bacterium]|nr:ABC transporter ATP-binding protein [Burkholderiales bacterium]
MADIEVRRLSKVYRSRAHPDGLLALDGIDLAVADHQFVCLLGPSGCGKSTVLNVLCGLDPQYAGEVRVAGRVVSRANGHPFRVGYVFQEPRLLPWLTVRRNVEFALQSEGIAKSEWRARCDGWLGRVGLADFAEAHPHELSGGMQQRTAIARAFAVDPEILLMDEPFSGLDELTARTMRELLLSIWLETKKTVIFVTHNCFEACFLADRIVVFTARPGRIKREVTIELPRPRNYEDARLFELSVSVTHHVTGTTARGTRLPD